MRLRHFLPVLGLLLLAPVPGRAQSNATDAAVEMVKAYLRSDLLDYTVNASDLADLITTRAYAGRGGATYVHLNQRHNGLEVYNGTLNATVRADGSIFLPRPQFVANLAARANGTTAGLSAAAAAQAAALELGLAADAASAPQGDAQVAPRLVYYATEAGPVRLAWDLSLYQPVRVVQDGIVAQAEWWSVRVDAQTGAILDRVTLIRHDNFGAAAMAPFNGAPLVTAEAAGPAFAAATTPTSASMMSGSYRVFAMPCESPTHCARSLVASPHDAAASPDGWHVVPGGSSYNITRGNNVYAYTDSEVGACPGTPGCNSADTGSAPDGGAARVFDFPYNPALAPASNAPAAVTNLFYWGNIVHDVAYRYGFNEVSGNFQTRNRGLTSTQLDDDAVLLEALDGSGTDNANFSTPADGSPGRMQMFRWTGPVTLNVTAPYTATYPAAGAAFGTPVVTQPMVGAVVIANSGGAEGLRGCTAYTNAAAVSGKIALVERGGCEFATKVQFAQDAGAIGAIIYNNDRTGPDETGSPEDLVSMGAGTTGVNPTIPSMFVQRSSGIAMRNQIAGLTVSGTQAQYRDSDFDASVIAHEYGHGISSRLVGNAVTCLGNADQMGEGWSDFYGLMLTMQAGDTRTTPRGIGNHVAFEGPNGPGIRPTPYSTDFAVNPYTYGGTRFAGTPEDPLITIPHGIGFIWATVLWEMTWDIIDVHGFSADIRNSGGTAGNQIALNIVTEGLKNTPCNPGFVDGREGILEADRLLYGGAHVDIIYRAFARRGVGQDASQGATTTNGDNVEGFSFTVASGDGVVDGPAYRITEARPNPFRGRTEFSLSVAKAQEVSVLVFDALGRVVATLHDGEMAAGATRRFSLDATGLAPGVYVVRLTGEDFAESRRVTVVR